MTGTKPECKKQARKKMVEQASPLDGFPSPDQLDGYVVEETDDGVRLHGYDVEADVAAHFGFGESLLLMLTGTAPDEETGAAFEVGLHFAQPMSIAQAPSHAARVARICGSDAAGVVAVAAIALTEQIQDLLCRYAPLSRWLDTPTLEAFPDNFRASCDRERRKVARMRALLPASWRKETVFEAEPDLWSALFGIFHRCGLRGEEQLLTALVAARLVCASMEGFAGEKGKLASYPVNLPRFVFVGEEE